MPAENALVGRSWHLTYPERWREELAALRHAGLPYRISRPAGGVRLHVTYPLSACDAVTLRVDFDMFPWFPPRVADPEIVSGSGGTDTPPQGRCASCIARRAGTAT